MCSAVIDPLVSHGRHYGRTVHAFCNISVLISNGLQRLVEMGEGRSIEDYPAQYVLVLPYTID